MDTIVIRDLRVEVLIGIYKRERYVPQTISIDLNINIPGNAVFASNKITNTIDYAQVAIKVKALGASQHFRLVETFAERIAKLLIGDFKAPWVKVTASKIGILPNAKFVGISIERGVDKKRA